MRCISPVRSQSKFEVQVAGSISDLLTRPHFRQPVQRNPQQFRPAFQPRDGSPRALFVQADASRAAPRARPRLTAGTRRPRRRSGTPRRKLTLVQVCHHRTQADRRSGPAARSSAVRPVRRRPRSGSDRIMSRDVDQGAAAAAAARRATSTGRLRNRSGRSRPRSGAPAPDRAIHECASIALPAAARRSRGRTSPECARDARARAELPSPTSPPDRPAVSSAAKRRVRGGAHGRAHSGEARVVEDRRADFARRVTRRARRAAPPCAGPASPPNSRIAPIVGRARSETGVLTRSTRGGNTASVAFHAVALSK